MVFETIFLYKENQDLKKTEKYMPKTDFFLKSIFSHLIFNHYNKFDPTSAINKNEKIIFEETIQILNDYKNSFQYLIKKMHVEMSFVTEDNVGSILSLMAKEIFSDCITWSRIAAFFVFIGEFTILCIEKKISSSIVDVIYKSFSKIVKEKLESWVDVHGGWEGIKSLSINFKKEENLFHLSKLNQLQTCLHHIINRIYNLLF